jgi:predicted RNA binding protein YcfA (HicA-like mRNA interferase family)
MSDVPSVSGSQAVDAFCKHGFVVVRRKGSHWIMKKDGHPSTLSVPVHGNRSLKRGTLRSLIRLSGLSVDQFVEVL